MNTVQETRTMIRRRFLAALMAIVVAATPEMALAAAPTQPLVTVTGITVNGITAEAGQLIADATVTLNVVGRTITQAVQIPLGLGGSPPAPGAPAGSCNILNLTLGPIHLDLLGLVVDLDNCAGGPVTVNITGDDSQLVGKLLCDVAGLLNGGLNLNDLLALLDPQDILDLTGALTNALNNVFAKFLPNATATAAAPDANGACSILHLMLGPIHLDLLGLVVDTSQICLSITAVQGPNNLLGNLLCSLSDLLNNSGNTGHAQLVLVRNILRVLNALGL
jgi:hypothetical protein